MGRLLFGYLGDAYGPRSSRKSWGDSLRYRQPERPPRATSLWCQYREKSMGWADWLFRAFCAEEVYIRL